MEFGQNALLDGPSLLGLLPLLIYIVLIFMNKSNLFATMAGIVVGAILIGHDLGMLANDFATSMGSFVVMIGLIIMLGAGLGRLMNESGITETLVYWVVTGLKVNSQNKARLALMIISIIICGLLGTLGGGNAIIAPIVIPVLASIGMTPTTTALILKNAGEVGLIWGPLTGVTLATLELTNMSYGQYMLVAGLPFGLLWLAGTWLASLYVQRRTEGTEEYDLSEAVDLENFVVEPKERNATIAFIVSFLALVIYGFISEQGTSYAIIVMLILMIVVTVFGRIDVKVAEQRIVEGVASMAELFLVFLTIDVLLEMVIAAGGFESLSQLLQNTFTNISASAVMLISSVVGGLGIEAAAVAELQIITDMFMPMIETSGLPLQMFAISLLAATRLTGSVYPTSNMIGQMGIAHSSNTKMMLQGNWISIVPVVLFVVIWAFLGLNFF
jgi:predicted histidine transporter YuiF (NhaC family)